MQDDPDFLAPGPSDQARTEWLARVPDNDAFAALGDPAAPKGKAS
jgi:hypothetical protein